MTLWATSGHSQDLEILRDDGVAAAWWTWSRHVLQQSYQGVEAGPVWISSSFRFLSTPHPLGNNEMLPFNMPMSQTVFQHLSTGKGKNWHKQQDKYKDATLKILFGYQFSHLHCFKCLGSMLVWFFDAVFNIFLIQFTLWPTNSQFSCTYLAVWIRDSKSSVSLISLVSLARFKAMPSMSYELVAGAEKTCGSWMFSACHCCDIRPYVFIRLPLGCKSTSSVYLY